MKAFTFPLRLAAGHRHYDHRLGPFLAKERGYFSAEGIEDVSIVATGEDDHTVAAMLAGEIDIGLDISPAKIIEANLAGADFRIIGSMQNGVRQVLTSKPEITSIEQLRGRRIHVVEQGSGVDWHPLRILLRKNGMDPDRDVVTVYNAPFPAFANADAAFKADICDARMMLIKEAPALREAGYSILHDFTQDYPAEYPQRTIVVTQRLIAEHPAIVEGFMKALIRAYRFMADGTNYDACMDVVHRNIHDENLGFPPGYPLTFHRGWGFKRPADGGMCEGGLQRFIDEEVLEGRPGTGLTEADIADHSIARRATAAIDAAYGPGRWE
jgi:hypothetical protein